MLEKKICENCINKKENKPCDCILSSYKFIC